MTNSRRRLHIALVTLVGLALACGGEVDETVPPPRPIGVTDLCHGRTPQQALDALPTLLKPSYRYYPAPSTLGAASTLTIELTYNGEAAYCVDEGGGSWRCPKFGEAPCVYTPHTSDHLAVLVHADIQSDDGRFANSAAGALDLAPDGTLTFSARLPWNDELSAIVKNDVTALHAGMGDIVMRGTASGGAAGQTDQDDQISTTIGTWN